MGAGGLIKMATLSIIIPVKNQLDVTKTCLETLNIFTKDYQLILVDDGSDEKTKNYLLESKSKFNCILITHDRSYGWCRSINDGIKLSEGNFIAFVNNDIAFTPDWSERMIKHFNENEKLGLVGPKTNYIASDQHVTKVGNKTGLIYKECLIFFCVIVRKEVIDQIGGLDERFDPGGQDDVDFCLRAKYYGWKIGIAGNVFVFHYGSATFREEFDYDTKKSQEFAQSRNDILRKKYIKLR